MKEMTIEAKTDNLDRVLAAVEEVLEEGGCAMKDQLQIDVAVEEIFVNIAHYAYTPDVGSATLQMSVEDEPRRFVMTFIDSGVPYDPLAKEDPDVSLPLEERQIGGLGIYMVKKSMDAVRYEYTDGRNILTIEKEF